MMTWNSGPCLPSPTPHIGPLMQFGQHVRPEGTRYELHIAVDTFEWGYLLGWGDELLNPDTHSSWCTGIARCRLDGSMATVQAESPRSAHWHFTCTLCGAEYTR